eukprot:Cvel_24388.t1-p1 / transcript=Cvel_24388.t1 / gene=Cvel_24388 / organism=Chromera_velia_CCMP2878 / gene_product=CCR4-NOT transcription complex subunit 7, putative / transcript_product=CCR4-NOT transcription complex subunit 7, putative / location=Cvel_scaffold2629:21855-26134(+) / protein_length=649 / sequence_SO=supercontig / SO=protein_coding / is_pseudo=false
MLVRESADLAAERDRAGIREVWADNLAEEFAKIQNVVDDFPYIAMDTEFPGIVARPTGLLEGRDAEYQFNVMKCNVDLLKVIQLGLTFADSLGNLSPGTSTWQFNFKFDLESDLYAEDSIQFLKNSGVDFEAHKEKGISAQDFGELLVASGLVLNSEAKWISFHGSFDFGYLLKILTCTSLPLSEAEFFSLLHEFFPALYDVKFLIMSTDADKLKLSGGFSLQKIAEHLDVTRVGSQHTAGSDSLVTCSTFFALMRNYFDNQIDDGRFSGMLYGLGPGVQQTQQQQGGFTPGHGPSAGGMSVSVSPMHIPFSPSPTPGLADTHLRLSAESLGGAPGSVGRRPLSQASFSRSGSPHEHQEGSEHAHHIGMGVSVTPPAHRFVPSHGHGGAPPLSGGMQAGGGPLQQRGTGGLGGLLRGAGGPSAAGAPGRRGSPLYGPKERDEQQQQQQGSSPPPQPGAVQRGAPLAVARSSAQPSKGSATLLPSATSVGSMESMQQQQHAGPQASNGQPAASPGVFSYSHSPGSSPIEGSGGGGSSPGTGGRGDPSGAAAGGGSGGVNGNPARAFATPPHTGTNGPHALFANHGGQQPNGHGPGGMWGGGGISLAFRGPGLGGGPGTSSSSSSSSSNSRVVGSRPWGENGGVELVDGSG